MKLIYPNIEGGAEVWLTTMKAICGDNEGKSMIDLGTCHAPLTTKLGFSETTFVDIQDRKLDNPEEQQNFVQANAIQCIYKKDVSIASDFIEHLTYPDANQLVESMAEQSSKHILFTPFGACNISFDDHPDSHRSAWIPQLVDYLFSPARNYAHVIFPNYHPTLGLGAFFFWHTERMEEDFERVKNILNSIYGNEK